MRTVLAKNILWVSPSQLSLEVSGMALFTRRCASQTNQITYRLVDSDSNSASGQHWAGKPSHEDLVKNNLAIRKPLFFNLLIASSQRAADLVKNILLGSLPAPAYTYTMEVHRHGYKTGKSESSSTGHFALRQRNFPPVFTERWISLRSRLAACRARRH